MLLVPSKIIVKETPDRGWGVFATSAISAGEVIEVSPLVKLRKPVCCIPWLSWLYHALLMWLEDYLYWSGTLTKGLCLGYGQLYNHSAHANVDFERQGDVLCFKAKRDIAPGEELTTFYKYRLFKSEALG